MNSDLDRVRIPYEVRQAMKYGMPFQAIRMALLARVHTFILQT